MTRRKVGVGFNHPLIIGERLRHDYRQMWNYCRYLSRLPEPLAVSAVEVHRRLIKDN